MKPLEWLVAQIGTPTDECVPWPYGGRPSGYGQVQHDGRLRSATQVALELAGRPRPSPAHEACHSCDNPPCVNPRHLRWGTRADNMADAHARGRAVAPPHTPGERNGRAKLTAAAAAAIRSAYTGERGQVSALARQHGVSRRAIEFVVQGVTWAGDA